MGCSGLSSLSLPLNFWPLTGAADVRAASGTRLSLLFLVVSFLLGPPDCPWLKSKLPQLFVRVTFAETDWQTGSGAHSLGGVSGVSVCGTGSRERRGLKGLSEHNCGCPTERNVSWQILGNCSYVGQESYIVMRKIFFYLHMLDLFKSCFGYPHWNNWVSLCSFLMCQEIRNVMKMCMIDLISLISAYLIYQILMQKSHAIQTPLEINVSL